MTREIKFRIYQNLNAPHEEPDWEVKEYEDIRYEPLCVVEGGLSYHIVRYTGLHDKNGKPVFEGDIVEKSYPKSKPQRRSMVFAIEYKELFDNEMGFSLGIGFDFHGEDSQELEVIGNIYEHPELLK